MIINSVLLEFDKNQSLVFYALVYSFSLVNVWLYTKCKKSDLLVRLLLFVGIVMPVILMEGLRFDVGTDYPHYENIFFALHRYVTSTVNEFKNQYMFLLENKIFYMLFKNPVVLFLFHAIIINVIFFLIVHDDKNDMFIMYIMFYFTILPVFFNIERQGVAILLVWYAFKMFRQRRIVPYILSFTVAIGFHTSALLFLPFYLLNYVMVEDKIAKTKFNNSNIIEQLFWKKEDRGKINPAIKYPVLAGLITIPVFLKELLPFLFSSIPVLQHYERYTVYGSADKGSMKALFVFAVLLVALFILKILIKDKKEYGPYVILSLISIACCSLDMYSRAGVGTRLMYYSQYGMIYLVGAACGKNKRRIYRLVCRLVFFTAAIIYYFYIFYYQNYAEVYPYKFIKISFINQ